MSTAPETQASTAQHAELRDLARVVKAALLMIVRYLEKRYHV